ncbi:MAG: DUF2922 family protein [Synergistaceae bacterium]|nr:DUF2922 family protein [Synergistaceae bacterium]
MANNKKLVMTFKCEDGKEHNFSWNHADDTMRDADAKNLADTIITNGSIFENVPVEATGAKVVVTTESELDIRE